jgi:hypothetical protein
MAITLPLQPAPDDLAHFAATRCDYLRVEGNPIRNRIIMERAVIRRAVTDLIAAGFTVRVYYGEGDYGCERTNDVNTVMAAIGACDEEWLNVRREREGERPQVATIYLVYGNDGYDVMADYHLSIEEHLKGANELSDQIANAIPPPAEQFRQTFPTDHQLVPEVPMAEGTRQRFDQGR